MLVGPGLFMACPEDIVLNIGAITVLVGGIIAMIGSSRRKKR